MAVQYSHPDSAQFNFDGVFSGNYTQAIRDPLPKIAHCVHTDVKELTWFNWAAVRAAIVNLGAEQVNVWFPEKAELRGWIWNRVLEIPEVRVRRITMPKSAYGANVDDPERQADIVRLKILYEEGGLSNQSAQNVVVEGSSILRYLHGHDLVALKSLDDIIHDPTTRATVMAL